MRAKKPHHNRKPAKQQIETLCDQAWPGDGVDPRYDRPEDPPKATGRKALQLCAQVQRALEHALASECNDPFLSDLEVLRVEPAPNTGRLLATLRTDHTEVQEIIDALRRAAGKLRCEVASAINRRKTPELAFCVVAARGVA